MSVESNEGKKLQWGNGGDISFTVKIPEESWRLFYLMIQSGLVGYTMTTAKNVCETCQFDKKCDCCPLHGVFEKASNMKAKIENEILANRKTEEEKK